MVDTIDSCVKSILDGRDDVISKKDIYVKIRKMRSMYEETEFDWNFGFIKVYVDNRNNIGDMLKMFFDKYKEASEVHDKTIEECYDDCDIEYLPRHVKESDIQIDKEGFLMDVGELSLLAYGDYGTQVLEVDEYLDDIVNSLKYMIKKYEGVKYEGAVSLEDSTDGPWIQLVGNVRDYSYTLKRLANQTKTDEIAPIYL